MRKFKCKVCGNNKKKQTKIDMFGNVHCKVCGFLIR